MMVMGKRLVFLDDYQLRIGDHVMCKHHDYTYDCDVIDYGSDPDTYVLKDRNDGSEMCYHISKLTKVK